MLKIAPPTKASRMLRPLEEWIDEEAASGRRINATKSESEENRRCKKAEGIVEIKKFKRQAASIFCVFAQLPQQSMLSIISSKAAGYVWCEQLTSARFCWVISLLIL